MLQQLPLSTYTFHAIRENGMVYIDKSNFFYELVKDDKGVFFLARPRRFGKSLLISTLSDLFKGRRDLFEGLLIDQTDYDWQEHPVIRIDFGQLGGYTLELLHTFLKIRFNQICEEYEVTIEDNDPAVMFLELIVELRKRNRVVILIDEYDKPLLDQIDDLDGIRETQRFLKRFYTVLKGMDEHLRFVFMTGISKFSKIGVFSGLNHLTDITMLSQFSTMLGLTEGELHEYLQPHFAAFAETKGWTVEHTYDQFRRWYNGYRFVEGAETVYNPFSVFHALNSKRLTNHWFQTGTPTFLLKLIRQQNFNVRRLKSTIVPEGAFSTYDIERLAVLPLLFQTGYMTIRDYNDDEMAYTLGYPNKEVEDAFLMYLLSEYSDMEMAWSMSHLFTLKRALEAHNVDGFFHELQAFFANIPYDIQIKQERYYQTVFYLLFMLMGIHIEVEVRTNRGRIDTVVALPDHIYLFEFKLDKDAEIALEQIKQGEYYQKYQGDDRPTTLIGATFDTSERNVTTWQQQLVS